MLALVLPLLVFAAISGSGELPKGVVIDRVETAANPRQSYALYLPAAYTPNRTWPILYCLDPGARGGRPVERFSKAAERAGVILVGSNNSRNGPAEPVREAIAAMVADTHARLSIDDSRVFAAGFSGGARLVLLWAQLGGLDGVIAVGAGFMNNQIPPDFHTRVFASPGIDDFNYSELYEVSRELASRGVEHRFEEFEGGHEWLSAAAAEHAIDYVLRRLPSQPAPESPEIRKAIANDRKVLSDLFAADGGAKRSTIEHLRKDAAQPGDNADRRTARRVIGAFYVAAIERGRAMILEKQYSQAADAYLLAVETRPEANWTWFDLAAARAGAGNKRGAIEALAKAIEHGFKDRARIDHEPLFDRIRTDARFKAVADTAGTSH